MKKIAITGGIGSGKSTVLKILREEGYIAFSCDEIYKEITLEKEYIEKISAHFPATVEQGVINKKTLANIVFSNDEKRELLDSIAHPFIMKRLEEKIENCKADVVFAEVPLLFEGGYYTLFDEIIVVKRALNERINAVVLRDGSNEQDVLNRINSQFDYQSKDGEDFIEKIGAKILNNNSDIGDLKSRFKLLINELM